MFIKELGRPLAVSSIPELERSTKKDAGFWNVVSIREPAVPRPAALGLPNEFTRRFSG
jgi:hypothetical protein